MFRFAILIILVLWNPVVFVRSCGPSRIDCITNHWGNWGPCSQACGWGQETRSREVIMWGNEDGQPCGQLHQTRDCLLNNCPVDCEYNVWAAWSSISSTCGSGTRSRQRSIAKYSQYNGIPCDQPLWQIEVVVLAPCPIHCELSDWEFSQCSEPCGVGSRTVTRTVTTPPQYGGEGCSSFRQYTEECEVEKCPIDCELSDWESSECSEACGVGFIKFTRSIKIPTQFGGKECSGDLERTENCKMKDCPIDCVVSDFEEWGNCSATCGLGTQERRRYVVVEPHHGGNTCPYLEEIQPCITHCNVVTESKYINETDNSGSEKGGNIFGSFINREMFPEKKMEL